MKERRLHGRILCADLVEVYWHDPSGQPRKVIANLEDISTRGANLLLDEPVERGTTMTVRMLDGEHRGSARYCRHEPSCGYFVGIEFGADSSWDPELYCPEHMLDPRSLLEPSAPREPAMPPVALANEVLVLSEAMRGVDWNASMVPESDS